MASCLVCFMLWRKGTTHVDGLVWRRKVIFAGFAKRLVKLVLIEVKYVCVCWLCGTKCLPGHFYAYYLGMWTSRNFRCSSISIRSFSIKITFRAEKFRATFEPSNSRAEILRTQFDPSRSRTSNRADFEHQPKWFELSKPHYQLKTKCFWLIYIFK